MRTQMGWAGAAVLCASLAVPLSSFGRSQGQDAAQTRPAGAPAIVIRQNTETGQAEFLEVRGMDPARLQTEQGRAEIAQMPGFRAITAPIAATTDPYSTAGPQQAHFWRVGFGIGIGFGAGWGWGNWYGGGWRQPPFAPYWNGGWTPNWAGWGWGHHNVWCWW